ncbi:hypothetical protein Tco_0940554 [Tanacetum coccineum]|uniref:Uncharacterized protein n=1 Tax=Tanacetum coccineum TaxID=301880 RepID=A0ABQ5DV32_9ASTR
MDVPERRNQCTLLDMVRSMITSYNSSLILLDYLPKFCNMHAQYGSRLRRLTKHPYETVKSWEEAVDLGEIQEEKIQHLLKSLATFQELEGLNHHKRNDSDSQKFRCEGGAWIGRAPAKLHCKCLLQKSENNSLRQKSPMEAVWIEIYHRTWSSERRQTLSKTYHYGFREC